MTGGAAVVEGIEATGGACWDVMTGDRGGTDSNFDED